MASTRPRRNPGLLPTAGPPGVNGDGVDAALRSYFANSVVSKWHRGSVNALFGDGSVRFMRKAETCEPRYLDRDLP